MNRLRVLRVYSGFTRKQVSAMLNISNDEYKEKESDIAKLDLNDLKALSKIYQMSIEEIVDKCV